MFDNNNLIGSLYLSKFPYPSLYALYETVIEKVKTYVNNMST